MANGIDKKALFKLVAEPYLKPISDLGVGFYNLDENTAKLRFQLSNSVGTLLISDENLKVYGYFESSNGSVSDVIELNIVDELNGIVEITLDQDFLHASTSTKVKGQLYIGIQNVSGKPEYNEVAVLGEFTFEVADALINKISSFTKVEYIRMFSQLKAQIEKEVQDIQDAIANGADYVAEMNTVKEQGITAINKTVTDGKAYIDNVIAQAQININDTTTSAITDVNTAKDNAISAMNTKVFESVGEVQNTSISAITHVDEKVTEFNTRIEENSFVQPTDLDNKLNELQWQRHKLTNDNGNANVITGLDMENIEEKITKAGFYWLTAITNGPVNINGVLQAIHGASDSYKKFIYTPHNSNRVFLKNKNGSVWTDWEEIGNIQTDTGWIPYNIINGGRANTVYPTRGGYKCSYRTITNGSVTERRVRVNADNVTHGQIIAQLPSSFAKELQVGYIRSTGDHNATNLLIETTGEVKVYIANDTAWQASDSKYIYGEISWVE